MYFLDSAASSLNYHCKLVALHLFVSAILESEARYAAWLHHCLGRQTSTHMPHKLLTLRLCHVTFHR
jgi:hypothetical protein